MGRNANFWALVAPGLLAVVTAVAACHGAPPAAVVRPAPPQTPANPMADLFSGMQGNYELAIRAIYDEERSEERTGSAELWVGDDSVVYLAVGYPVHPKRIWDRIWYDPQRGIRSWFLNVTPREISGPGQLSPDGKLALEFQLPVGRRWLRMVYTFASPGSIAMDAYEIRDGGLPVPAVHESWRRVSTTPDRTWAPVPER